MSRHFCVLVNPTAASGRAIGALREAERELRAVGATFEVAHTESLEHAAAQAQLAAARGETVMAIGGDGLVGALAGALQNTTSPLALVPAGRGNDLARVLGIPAGPRAAVRLALEGEPRTIDVGEVNGRSFVGIASVGFDSVANAIANRTLYLRGRVVYLVAALRALARWQPASFEIAVNGRTERFTGFSVAVCNSRAYGGGMLIAPHAQLDDGQLDVVTVADKTKLGFLRCFPRVFRGGHLGDPDVGLLSATEVTVSADRSFTVYADGEPLAELPATVRVHQKALAVITEPPSRG